MITVKVQTHDVLWCMLSDEYVIDNMNSVTDVWVCDCKWFVAIKVWLHCDLEMLKVWLAPVTLDQVCW